MNKSEYKKRRFAAIIIIISMAIIMLGALFYFFVFRVNLVIKEDLPLFKYKEHLLEDESSVFSEQGIVIETSEFPSKVIDYSNNDFAVMLMNDRILTEKYFDFLEQEAKSAGSIYETKRGIKIGSTAEDIIEAYSGMECMVIDYHGEHDYLPVQRLGKARYSDKLTDRFSDTYIIRITACYAGEDSCLKGEFFDRRNIVFNSLPDTVYKYEDYPLFIGSSYVFSTRFLIEDNKAINITIRHWELD